jgi:hypothetical protein
MRGGVEDESTEESSLLLTLDVLIALVTDVRKKGVGEGCKRGRRRWEERTKVLLTIHPLELGPSFLPS